MKRQTVDGGASWFDLDKAEHYVEDEVWNGSNHISLATGSQWNHEALYRTRGGAWVLRQWSQWQGSGESWDRVTDAEAMAWLATNNHHDAVRAFFPAEDAAAEI